MFCKFCGRNINEKDKFCPYCGGQLIFDDLKEEVKNKDAYKESKEISILTKILFAISFIVVIVTFLPYNEIMPIIALISSLIMFVINMLVFSKERSKYNIFLIILNIVLVLSNINSIVLYSILR